MKDDTADGVSIESTVLAAIDAAVVAQEGPVSKAVADSFKAKWYAIVAVIGLILSLLALIGVAKILDDSRIASAEYREDSCARENQFRADDYRKWQFFLALATEDDPSRPPLTAAQKARQADQVARLTKFLKAADAPLDCAALARELN